MSTIIQDIERRQLREVPRFKAGDTVRVHFRVIEGSRQRIQVFRASSSSARAPAPARRSPSGRTPSGSVSSGRSRSTRRRSTRSRCRRSATSTARSSTTCAARSARRLASASCARADASRGACRSPPRHDSLWHRRARPGRHSGAAVGRWPWRRREGDLQLGPEAALRDGGATGFHLPRPAQPARLHGPARLAARGRVRGACRAPARRLRAAPVTCSQQAANAAG